MSLSTEYKTLYFNCNKINIFFRHIDSDFSKIKFNKK